MRLYATRVKTKILRAGFLRFARAAPRFGIKELGDKFCDILIDRLYVVYLTSSVIHVDSYSKLRNAAPNAGTNEGPICCIISSINAGYATFLNGSIDSTSISSLSSN